MHVVCRTAVVALLGALSASGQQRAVSLPTPLSQLLREAEGNNPQIASAVDEARAAGHVAQQVTTLPDPKLTYQQFSVGSPRPFAGYTNSDFAYVGIGASQELPYPGKLRLRGEVAQREAERQQREVGVIGSSVADGVKSDYLELAYLREVIGILRENEAVLDGLIEDATARYAVGQGMQQDVLEAQLNRTRMVREITARQEQQEKTEAHLKGLLNRDPQSADIVPEALSESPLRATVEELLARVRGDNPEIQVDASAVEKEDARVASAKREGRPDFALGYMYQNTDRRYRDYYMFTFDVRFPRRKRVKAQVAKAEETRIAAQESLDAHLAEQRAGVKEWYVEAASDGEQLKEFREGLLPQSDAAYRATVSAYASGKAEFAHVLLYLTDVLNLKLECAETLVDHESALAHLETLTGAKLR